MPEADDRVVTAFHKTGMCEYSMGGQSPLTWAEINAYSSATSSNLDGWEKEQIRAMSEQYCSWSHKGKTPTQPPPYNPYFDSEEGREEVRANVNNQWQQIREARRKAKQEAAKVNQKAKHLKPENAPLL